MVSYIVKFAADPYDKDSGIPQWWPNYICEKEITDMSIVEGKKVCTMKFRLGKQYAHQFENYINDVLGKYTICHAKSEL